MIEIADVLGWVRRLAVVILTAGLVACQQAAPQGHGTAGLEDFGEPLAFGSAVRAAVNEYFHLRKLAVVRGDIEILWSRFPDLRVGEDVQTGVNVERRAAMRSDSAPSLADVIYDIDRGERAQVRMDGDRAVVCVHGLERYISGDFSDGMAAEFIRYLHLRREAGGDRWSVVRTDEVTLPEYHDRGRC